MLTVNALDIYILYLQDVISHNIAMVTFQAETRVTRIVILIATNAITHTHVL